MAVRGRCGGAQAVSRVKISIMPKQGVNSRKKVGSGKARASESSKQAAKQAESKAVTITVHSRPSSGAAGHDLPPREGKVIDASLTSAVVEKIERHGNAGSKKRVSTTQSPAAAPKKRRGSAKALIKSLRVPKLPKLSRLSKSPKPPKPKPATGFHLPRPVRRTLISAGVMLMLFVVAGVAYTFYIDGQSTPLTSVPVNTAAEYHPIKPHKPAANAKEGAAVELLTTPVAAGSNASISVRTNPTSTCTITVVYGKTASTDSGLTSKVADAFGTVSWSWTVDTAAPVGTWPVKVTCAYNKQTAVVQGDLEVQK